MIYIGLSSYCLQQALTSGEMTIPDSIRWIKENGAEHVEIAPVGYTLENNLKLVDEIIDTAAKVCLPISGYMISANFLIDNEKKYEAEIVRVKRHVDIAHRLKVKLMRHDVGSRPRNERSIAYFEADLGKMVHACREIANYAMQYGITTSVENHGVYMQASDRIQRLINAVERTNFKTTLDIGNFICVGEDPVSAVKKNISYASIVHLKDFYIRPSYSNPGEGWTQLDSGKYLRGAIIGHGDIDIREVIRVIKQSQYNGYITIEFEGIEECRKGTRISLENAKRIWSEVQV